MLMSGITARSDQQPVPLLVTVTLTYSVMEDRVRLDGIDSEGETLTLWLTARLLSRLIPYLQQQQPEKRSMHQVSRVQLLLRVKKRMQCSAQPAVQRCWLCLSMCEAERVQYACPSKILTTTSVQLLCCRPRPLIVGVRA